MSPPTLWNIVNSEMTRLKNINFNILLLVIQLTLALSQWLPQDPYNPCEYLYDNRNGELCANQNYKPYKNFYGNLFGSACDNPTYNTCGNLNSNLGGEACGIPNCKTCSNGLDVSPNINLYGIGCGNPNCNSCGILSCNTRNNACNNPLSNLYGRGSPSCNQYSNGCANPSCNLYDEPCRNPTDSAYSNPYGIYGYNSPVQAYIAPHWQPEAVYPQPASNQPPVIIINDDDGEGSRDFRNEELYT